MSLLPQKFADHLTHSGLRATLEKGCLVAWSGGLDSTVLVHLLQAAGIGMEVAHCNFGLRGAESDGDADFVRAQAKAWGLPCHVQSFKTEAYATAQGVSTQMAARKLRYDWFAALLEQSGKTALLTAHHANDQAETVLMHLIRGTGWKGLGGMAAVQPFRNQCQLIRPLLPFSRYELETYALFKGLQWREDRSNAADDYQRNFLRHQVMPHLETVQPALLDVLNRSGQYIQAAVQNYRHLLERQLRWQPTEQGYALDIAALQTLPEPAAALWEMLHPFGFEGEQVRQMATHLMHPGMEWRSERGTRAVMDRKQLLVALQDTAPIPSLRIEEDDLMVRIPGLGRLILTYQPPQPPYPDGKTAVMVDVDTLSFPLVLRQWEAGDAFQPFGMKGQKQKLQDFFTNHKLSRLEKEQVRVLANAQGELIWVVGWRLDHRFAVRPETQKALKIALIA